MSRAHLVRSRSTILVLVFAVVIAVVSVIASKSASAANGAAPRGRSGSSWFTSWAQSQQSLATSTLAHQSVRMITHLSQGGDALRIRIQNQFGKAPLTIDAAAVGVSGEGADVIAETSRPVTFPGHPGGRSVTIPVGGQAWSDPIQLKTRPQDDIAVSMYVAGTVTPGQHRSALRDNYMTAPGSGNHVADTSGSAYTQTVTSTYFVSAVDVHNPKLIGAIVGYGSSVVDGTGSTNCGPGCTVTGNNRRWVDDLARRVVNELPANQQLAVANAGIGGTTSSDACPDEPASVVGLDARARLDRDVLALHGVTGVIYYYGTNDLQDNCTADQILAANADVFQSLHRAGIKVYVVPTTPRPIYTDQMNLYRYKVDSFIYKWNNCGGTCDGIVNFDQVLKDPLRPNIINPAFDNGDGIHANIAGQQAEADAVSLPLLVSSTGHGGHGR